jgi:hypothetical protein
VKLNEMNALRVEVDHMKEVVEEQGGGGIFSHALGGEKTTFALSRLETGVEAGGKAVAVEG